MSKKSLFLPIVHIVLMSNKNTMVVDKKRKPEVNTSLIITGSTRTRRQPTRYTVEHKPDKTQKGKNANSKPTIKLDKSSNTNTNSPLIEKLLPPLPSPSQTSRKNTPMKNTPTGKTYLISATFIINDIRLMNLVEMKVNGSDLFTKKERGNFIKDNANSCKNFLKNLFLRLSAEEVTNIYEVPFSDSVTITMKAYKSEIDLLIESLNDEIKQRINIIVNSKSNANSKSNTNTTKVKIESDSQSYTPATAQIFRNTNLSQTLSPDKTNVELNIFQTEYQSLLETTFVTPLGSENPITFLRFLINNEYMQPHIYDDDLHGMYKTYAIDYEKLGLDLENGNFISKLTFTNKKIVGVEKTRTLISELFTIIPALNKIFNNYKRNSNAANSLANSFAKMGLQ